MMSAAWPSFTEAWYSPRRLRSSATLALGFGFLCHGALHVVGEGDVFISTAVTCVPQGSVCPSITFLICSLMLAVSEIS